MGRHAMRIEMWAGELELELERRKKGGTGIRVSQDACGRLWRPCEASQACRCRCWVVRDVSRLPEQKAERLRLTRLAARFTSALRAWPGLAPIVYEWVLCTLFSLAGRLMGGSYSHPLTLALIRTSAYETPLPSPEAQPDGNADTDEMIYCYKYICAENPG